ncbi:MAG: GrlR family regulatory protein [Pseudomonadota bacterium]
MAFEGIWTAEVFGPHGWDKHGVLLLQAGRLAGGDNQQCTMGTYKVRGDGIEAELMVDYYDEPRTIFGESAKKYTTRLTGTLNGSVIKGLVVRHDRPEFELQIRLTKRMDLSDHDQVLPAGARGSHDKIDLTDEHVLPASRQGVAQRTGYANDNL